MPYNRVTLHSRVFFFDNAHDITGIRISDTVAFDGTDLFDSATNRTLYNDCEHCAIDSDGTSSDTYDQLPDLLHDISVGVQLAGYTMQIIQPVNPSCFMLTVYYRP